jgi:MSHA biogenesis protein MshQ
MGSEKLMGSRGSHSGQNIKINEIMYDPLGGHYDDDWIYRKKITINSSQVTGDLTDFPILINLTDYDLKNKARMDGYDILFTADDCETKLDFEIELFDSNSGELFAWIKIPYLDATNDTDIYMYYGNPDAEDQSNTLHSKQMGHHMVM